MKDIFDEDFFKFLLGFSVIILLMLGVIFWAESAVVGEADANPAVDTPLPIATTTSSQ